MKTYYFAIFIAFLILGSTFLITSWGFIMTSIKNFLKKSVKGSVPVNTYYKSNPTAQVEISSTDRDSLRRKK